MPHQIRNLTLEVESVLSVGSAMLHCCIWLPENDLNLWWVCLGIYGSVVVVVMVMVLAFSFLARILRECSAIHSLPVLFVVVVV